MDIITQLTRQMNTILTAATAEYASALQDTDYQHYFSAAYANWQTVIEEMSAELAEASLGQRLVSHEKLGDNLYASTFADGSVIYVNYGGETARVGNIQIPAMDFVRKEAGK